jgi:hypothetical protein
MRFLSFDGRNAKHIPAGFCCQVLIPVMSFGETWSLVFKVFFFSFLGRLPGKPGEPPSPVLRFFCVVRP